MTERTQVPATPESPDPQPAYHCFHCSGLGEVPVHYPDDKGGFYCNWQRCKHCAGTGKWQEEGR